MLATDRRRLLEFGSLSAAIIYDSVIDRDYETSLHAHYDRPGYWVDELAVKKPCLPANKNAIESRAKYGKGSVLDGLRRPPLGHESTTPSRLEAV